MTNKKILTLISLLLFLFLLVGCFPKLNQAPEITSTPVTAATVGVAYTYDVNATDPDGDALTYFLSVKPSGMTINSATGLIKWTPTAAQVGDNSVTVMASDGSLNITQPFTVKVSKPTPTPIPVKLTKIVVLPETMSLIVGESETIVSVTAHYSNGSTKDIALSKCTYASSAIGVATVDTGVITAVAEGTTTITVTYKDKTDKIVVTVSKPPPFNHAPVITSDPIITAEIGVEYTYNVETFDEDGDAITYSLTVYPNGMVINSITGVISWIPCSSQAGANAVTVEASDGAKTATQSFVVVVEALPIVIDGILSPNEWDKATVISVASGKGTARVLATVDYLYASFDLVDLTDVRLSDGYGDDKIGLNINPTNGGVWGHPYDLIFQTGINPAAWSDISSGQTDGYETQWYIEGVTLSVLPTDVETKTIFYSGDNRITEWKIPLASLSLACGGHFKVGGATDIEKTSYKYPVGLLWDVESTYFDIVVY